MHMRTIATLACLLGLQLLCYFVSPNTKTNTLFAQCPTVASMLVDACPGGGEAENEYVIFETGAGFTVGDLVVDFAVGNNAIGSMGSNNDINTNVDNDPAFPNPCGLQAGDPSVYTGGCNIIPVGPGFVLPANAIFILQTSNDPTHSVDLSGLCAGGQDIYLAQNSCDRTIGAFTNGGSGTRTTNFSYGIAGCNEAVTYDRGDVVGGNGAYYSPCLATPYGNVSSCSPPDLSSCFMQMCPPPETHTFFLCADGPVISPAQSLAPAQSLWAGASTVSFHNSMTDAMNGNSPVTNYGGSTASPVSFFARVVYPDGCVVIGTLIIDFLFPDGNAGTDATISACSNGTVNLLAALGGGVTAGSFSDDDGSGVNLSNPSSVDFTGVSNGSYQFTYTTIDNPSTPCPPDMATVTVNVTTSPVANTPSDPFRICYTLIPFTFSTNGDDIINQISGGIPLQFYLDAAGTNLLDITDPADILFIINTQPGFIFANYVQFGCPSNIVPIAVELVEAPSAFGPQTIGACETNNGFAQFNLTTLNDAINGGSGANVNYYFDAAGNNQVLNPGNFNSPAGTLFAIVDNGVGCPSTPVVVNLVVNPNPSIMGVISNPSCNNIPNGAINLTITDGTPNYTFSWDPATLNGQEDPMALGGGIYIVTVTDDNGCEASRDFTLVEPDPLVLVSCAELMPASDPATADGSATITITGGTADYTINYSGPSSGSVMGSGPDIQITGLAAGNYTIDAVLDDNGCSISPGCMFTITSPTPCNLTFQCSELNPASGPATADGAVTFIFGGGTPDYTIDITGPTNGSLPALMMDGTTDFLNLLPGNYTATLTDDNGCSTPCNFTIGQPPVCNLMVDGDSLTPISCFDANDGTITLDVTGNNGTLDIQWSILGFEDQLQAMVGPGIYGVTVTDEGTPNCFVPLNGFSFTAPDTLRLSCMAGAQTSTPLATDGTGIVNFSGGTPPYSLSIDGANPMTFMNELGPSFTFNNLGVGVYNVTLTDANGCSMDCQFTVTAAGCTLDVMVNATSLSCNGDDNGAISLLISGNNGAVTVDWAQDQFDGQQDISPLMAGEYNVTVTDLGGCSVPIGPIVISEPDELNIECSTLNDVSNPNAMDGRARAIISGGTAPYQVILRRLILNTSVNDTFNLAIADALVIDSLAGNSPAQDYDFVVIDANGCTDTCNFSIFEPPCPNIFVMENITNINCPEDSSGRIEITPVNAQAPIQYIWTPTLPDTNVVDGLGAGNYQLILIDSFQCTFAAVYTITQPDSALTISCMALTDETIPGATDGTASVDIMGDRPPFTLDIYGPDTTSQNVATSGTVNLSNLAAGSYAVVVTDNNGCVSDTCNFVIDAGSCDLMVSAAVSPADCSGPGQIVITNTGGTQPFSYDWSDDTYDGLDNIIAPPGLYLVTVTDGAGCEATAGATITAIDNAPQLDIAAGQIGCQGDSVDVNLMPFNGQSSYTYFFSTFLPSTPDQISSLGDTTVSFPIPIGTTNNFRVNIDSITDANGCTTVIDTLLEFIISAPDTVVFSGPNCINDTITIEGNDYFASNPSDTFLLPGGQCGLLYIIDFTFNEPIIDTFETTLCPTESLTIGNMTFDNNNTEGLANLGMPASTGCDSSVYVRVDFFPVSQGSFTTTVCEGDTVFFEGDIYTEDNPDGVTILEGADVNGCDSLVFVIVNFQPTARITLSSDDSNICLGDTIMLNFETANGGPFNATVLDGEGNTYNFGNVTNGNSFPVSPDFSTTFTLVSASQGGNNCPLDFGGEASVLVSRLTAGLEVGLDLAGFQISCHGANDGQISANVIEGIPPYSFEWADGTQGRIRENLGAGNYVLTITDSVGCQRILSENLQEPPPLLADPRVIPPGCNETEGLLVLDTIRGGIGPYEVTVDGTFFQAIRSFPYTQLLPPDNYQLEIRDLADCPQTYSFNIPASADPELIVNQDTILNLGDSILLRAQTNFTPDSIQWSPAAYVSVVNSLNTMATPEESTRFQIIVSDTTGCRATATVFVMVDERVPIYIPNAFSPNTDGANDLFRVFGNAGVERINAFRIFNRWGEMVYESMDFDINNPRIGWDGKFRGDFLNPQVLVYYVNATLTNGRVVELKGDLTLLR